MNTEFLSEEEYTKLRDGEVEPTVEQSAGSLAAGPRRGHVHNPRLLGTRAYTEKPSKPKHRRKGKAQRQARKANR